MAEPVVHSVVHEMRTLAGRYERATGGAPLIVGEYQALWLAQALMADEPRMTLAQAGAVVAALLYVAHPVPRPMSRSDATSRAPGRGWRRHHPTKLIIDEMAEWEAKCGTSLTEVRVAAAGWSDRDPVSETLAIRPALLARCERFTR